VGTIPESEAPDLPEGTAQPVEHRGTGVRRHDIDALRAIAMLLGICLHALMPYTGEPWVIVDNHTNRFFVHFVAFIHSFRMQLFFLISGFFTAMLANRSGPVGMLKNRVARILLPLVICIFTLMPLVRAVDILAISSTASHPQEPLFRAIQVGDADRVLQLLDAGPSQLLGIPDCRLKITPLGWAILWEQDSIFRMLLEKGADPKGTGEVGYNPLCIAAMMGRTDLFDILVQRGGDPLLVNETGSSPWKLSQLDARQTRTLLWLAKGKAPDNLEALEKGHHSVREYLYQWAATHSGDWALSEQPGRPKSIEGLPFWIQDYFGWLASDQAVAGFAGLQINLLQDSLFGHLWFLYFLWWMCLFYAGACRLGFAPGTGRTGGVRWLYVGLIVAMIASCVFQLLMGIDYYPGILSTHVGADLSVGLIPKPHVLLYYAVFFLFGCWYHGLLDHDCKLGRNWVVALLAAAFVFYPLIFASDGQRLVGSIFQTLFTWAMVIGSIGAAHRIFNRESKLVKYVADSSYWLYLVHLPLVILLEWLFYFYPWPAGVKVVLILAVTVSILIGSYQLLVRHTVIGRILNGKNPARARPWRSFVLTNRG
jgi:fucose 4-O-acetylase-like acetyltransferase